MDNMQYQMPGQGTSDMEKDKTSGKIREHIPAKVKTEKNLSVPKTEQGSVYAAPAIRTPPVYPMEQMPEIMSNTAYIPGYLRQHIGKWVRLECLTGGQISDRIGRLTRVGASYIVLQPAGQNDTVMCDLNSIKFATIADGEYMQEPYVMADAYSSPV